MPYSAATVPTGFPLNFVLAAERDVGGHQLYVMARWHGPYGGPQSVDPIGEYWQMGCLLPDCNSWQGSVLTTGELIRELTDGHVVGYRHPPDATGHCLVVTVT